MRGGDRVAGFWDRILGKPVTVLSPNQQVFGSADFQGWVNEQLGWADMTPAAMFRTQPHLRTVVSFLARNVAQLGLQTFERVDETDRKRDRTSAVARALAFPDGAVTTYDLIFATVGDMCLYDRAYWFVAQSAETPTGWIVRRLPPSWVSPADLSPFRVASWTVTAPGADQVTVPAAQILDFTGYSPTSQTAGSSTVEALKDTLSEQIEASRYRGQVWKRGGRVSAVIQRPQGAPQWSDAARSMFRDDWYAKFTGRGPGAGGTPILEDGMTLQRVDFNAQEQQFVEAAKLSLTTVAAAFHVNPTMIGQNDGANYSNVREFRRMLYGDTLGPMLAQIEARVNTFLLPMLGVDPERFYCEFNIAEKLQGSFEEQAAALQTSVGGPWMTRAEARARMNLPAITGADELIVPMNVTAGGQASPSDSGSQNRNAGPLRLVKAKSQRDVTAAREQSSKVLGSFFDRQSRVIKSALGRKDGGEWWDGDRWDEELASDLFDLAMEVTPQVAGDTLKSIGFAPDEYDPERTAAWLTEVSQRSASSINQATKDRITEALDSDDPDALDAVFAAQPARAESGGSGLGTLLASFATVEAARQVTNGGATKTWVTGPNPRPEHAALDGETVGLDEDFSNGAPWPGGDGEFGCNCDMIVQAG